MSTSNLTNQVILGDHALPLWVIFKAGSVWNPTFTAMSAPVGGTPVNWPAGTTAWITVTDGTPDTSYNVTYNATVSGANISWNLTTSQCSAVPDGSHAQIYVDQSGNGSAPNLWMSGTVSQES